MAGCGGGGGGGESPASSVAPPPASATLAIAAFTPASGGVGSVVSVTGSGFTGLQDARVGSIDAAFTVVSDTQLQLTVPAGAQTGRIELTAPGRSVLSGTDFTIVLVPQLTSISPSSVLPGARVTLNGFNLDRVTRVRLNAMVLPIVSQSAGAITVTVPSGVTTGRITLDDGSGSRLQSQQLTIAAPMTLTSFTPTSIVTGQTLTINGTGLDRASSVVFAGGASANVATHSGTTRITVTVPDTAADGALRVRAAAGDEVVSAAALSVTAAIRVNASAVYRVASAGGNVTIAGTGLTEVGSVTVKGIAANIVSRDATQLVFTVPAGAVCGAISLHSASQPSVAAGSVVVGGGCAATVAGVEFGQVLGQAVSDVRQRLVPGKETWVRVYVLSNQAGVVSPTVRLTGYRGAAILGTLTLAGPATLPQAAGSAIPDGVRYSETQSFNVQLPAAWIAAGLSVRVEVDPEQRLGPPATVDATPTVGTPTHLEIVLVPLVSGGFVPTPPSTAAVLDELTRRFPIPRDRITVTTRANYTLTSVTNGLDTDNDWNNALSELLQLRNAENPTKPYRYYFGFVRRSGGGIAGIGYVPGRTAVGWDSAGGWVRTMSHELGHNFGRPHAPCGGPASPDPGYPYAGGVLGATPLIDSVPAALDVISPVNLTDIMGYCSGSWFSDYNYRLMQSHLESQPQTDVAAAQSASDQAQLLLISGRITAAGVELNPVQALRGAPSVASGDHTLRLTTADGRSIEIPFNVEAVDHAEPAQSHFAFTVLNPGALARAEVRRDNILLPSAMATASAQRARTTTAEPLTMDWSESGGRLQLHWNVSAASHVSVTHALNGERTVVALQRSGGVLVVDTSTLPAGGVFEVSVSEGLNAQLLTLKR